MSKVRINDLARELEVKSRAILDALTHVGVTEKKTHSSSLEEDEAERVRQHFQRSGKNGAGAARVVESEPKQKIDWSRVSKPGDVLKAIQQRKDEAAAAAQRPPQRPPVTVPSAHTPAAQNPPAAPPAPVAPPRPAAPPAPPVAAAAAPSAPPSAPPAPSQGAVRLGAPGQARPNLGNPNVGGQGQRFVTPAPPAPRRIVP